MIFAIPAAVQGASIAVKILIVVAIVAALFGLGFAAGKHWEKANTVTVQARFDKAVSDAKNAKDKQSAESRLKDQDHINKQEKANEENDHARAGIKFYADQLWAVTAKNRTATVMPGPIADAGGSGLTCFDSEQLIGADEAYRGGETSRRASLYRSIEEGAKDTADLNTVKLWKQSLRLSQ